MTKKFTGNYSFTEHNFVIQNLPVAKPVTELHSQIIAVLSNIFLRGAPTIMSKYLQESLSLPGYLNEMSNKTVTPLITTQKQNWYSTIKGDVVKQYFPAKEFYQLIPTILRDYPFVQNLILPEALISDIIEHAPDEFIDQHVDFYLEQARLIIEIDGEQHVKNKALDTKRVALMNSNGIITIRIKTEDIRGKTLSFWKEIDNIKNRLDQFAESKNDIFLNGLNTYRENSYSDEQIENKLLPTACLRWQITVLELLKIGFISLSDKVWNFNIISNDLESFVEPATQDLILWFTNLFCLHNQPFTAPKITIQYTSSFVDGFINVDFSLLKRYTDENLLYPSMIFVRTAYLQRKNYFEVSTSNPITYRIVEQKHKSLLEFFLLNIFYKPRFREGQLAIICNALNRKDTIGLLPTGGGKSICYQLTAILQPGVSFIISPLKSLMFDQKENLDRAYFSNTNYISSDQTAIQREYTQKSFEEGKYLFIWIAPERLQIKTFREYLSTVNNKYKIIYAVIDEVHCLSEWGHDFRTSYLNLARIVKHFCQEAKYLGLTATASSRVHRDIKAEFGIEDTSIVSLNKFDREELTFVVQKCSSNEKIIFTKQIIENFQKENGTSTGVDSKAGIIFTPHVNWKFGCYGVYKVLENDYPTKIDYYSGEVPRHKVNGVREAVMPEKVYDEYKLAVQKNFRENKFPLLVSTKAFGMGIDKPNINLTIHFGISPSIESIYQEAGRAGRHEDKLSKAKSKCYILFSDEANEEIRQTIENSSSFNDFVSLQEKYMFQGDDLFRQLYFFTEAFTGEENELQDIVSFAASFFVPQKPVKIQYSNIKHKAKLEKCIYRLSLLNVVDDYTIDFNSKEFEVSFNIKTDDSVFNGLYTYVNKFEPQPEEELKDKVNEFSDLNLTARCLRYLIYWIYNNIATERRQALKGIADLCRNSKSSEAFKAGIAAYFEITEVTFLLQYISEYPTAFYKWFEVFYKKNKKGEIINVVFTEATAMEDLKLKLQRFLESYNANVGFNFISGIVRLVLNDFEDKDGRERFEYALENIKNRFQQDEQETIVSTLLEWGKLLTTRGRFNLSNSTLKFFPVYSQRFYESLGDTNSLDILLHFFTDKLQEINTTLYGGYE